MTYAHGPNPNEASMRSLDFKDKFFPGYHWQRQAENIGGDMNGMQSMRSVTGDSDNRTESMHVDNILAGIRHEDVKKDVI